MSDLSDFGGGVEATGDDVNDTDDSEEAQRPTYRNGRCPAIAIGSRERCRSPISRMTDADGFCGTHGRYRDPWSIDDPVEKLILATGELDALSLDEVDAGAVDFDVKRIKRAVEAVDGRWER